MSKFVATRNKGFAMTFDNNYTISVQWGTENYCEKKHTTIIFKYSHFIVKYQIFFHEKFYNLTISS